MLRNKNIKIFINYFLGPVLFLWLAFSIFHQVKNQPQLEASWHHIVESLHSTKLFYLVFIVLLMPVNWGLEAAKWRLSVDSVHPVTFIQAFKAVLSGVSFSVTMPNRVGDYLGRILYLPEGKRLRVITLTVVGSLSQILVTLTCGIIGLIILKNRILHAGILNSLSYQVTVFGFAFFTLLLFLFYFNLPYVERLMEQWLRRSSYLYLVEALRDFGRKRLTKLLVLSLVRYGVFILQYILAFHLFDVNVSLLNLVLVMTLVFAALAVIPTIVLLEIGIRGQVSLQLLGMFTANSLGVLFTSLGIWFINLIVPALAGSILILSIKVFKRRYEE